MIYADNTATTRISDSAKKAMLEGMDCFWGNPSSLHTPGRMASEALKTARETIASCIGASPQEIYFTSGGSEADNQAIVSTALLSLKEGKKHLISTAIEHHAVLHTLKRLEQEGFEVTLLPVTPSGIVRVEDVAAAIRPDTALVTVMFANNEIGTIQPIEEIGTLCQGKKVSFHTDAVQAAGHLPIDVEKQHIDMLSLSAHKFHGPKGIGVLYVRKGLPLLPLIDGGSQERGKRAGTENLPAIMGMAVALEEACEKMDFSSQYVSALRDTLIDGLSIIPHSILNGDRYKRLPGNVNFCFEGIEGESLLLLLDRMGIAASSGSACNSFSLEPSHVLLAIGRSPEIAYGSLRLTLCEENTKQDTQDIIRSVIDAVSLLRNTI